MRWASRSWLPLAAAIAGVLATVLLWRSLLAVERRQLAFVADAQARSAAAQVQHGMQAVTDALVGVARRFGPALREDRPWEFQITGLQATLWVEPSGKVGWVTPREGHQGLIGTDLTSSDADRAALVKAAATGKPSLTPSVVLPPQDSSFHLIVPVTAAGHLEGFFVGFFSAEVIYRAVLQDETARGWALAVFESDRELYRRGSPIDGRWIAESEVKILDVERHVRAGPSPAVIAGLHSPLPAVVLATGSVIALLLAASIGLAQSARRRAGEAEAAQAALRVGEQQLRAVLDNTMALVYVKDAEGRYLLLNRRMDELFGRPRAEILGKTDRDLFPDDTASRVRANDLRVLETGAPLQIEETALLPDGLHTYLAVKVPLFDAARVPYAVCGISTDITEQKRYEETRRRSVELEEHGRRAREASRLKSEFLANMSHELRTPLNAIIGFAEIMHDEKVGPLGAEQREYLGDILTSSRHLLQLINDVLDLSKVEAGKMEFRPETLDPARIVVEIRDMLRSLAASKRIAVTVDAAGEVGEVSVDPAKLKQVLYNYLSNALKFTPEGGRVTVRVAPEGPDDFRIEVEDTGIGIRPEDMARLFVEFQQLDATTAKKYPGTGLGLALTKRIVEAQGGGVGARSTPGQGSIFHAVLPRATSASTAVDARVESSPASGSVGPALLVVEDDTRDREWLRATLTRAGYVVETAATSAEAIARADERKYDAITLDMLLPDGDGRDVLAALRARGPNVDTPVVVVTVVTEAGIVGGFHVHEILTKPVSEAQLVASIAAAGVAQDGRRPILLVDDDASAVKLAAVTLETAGYRAVCCRDGPAALRAAQDEPPAAVVVDLDMPGMDGFAVLDELRRRPTSQSIPVLVWTVLDLSPEKRARLLVKAQAVVAKSAGIEALVDRVRAFVPSGTKAAPTT